jgi:large subunit ribosomal protein L6
MSRIGKIPVSVPQGVDVNIRNNEVVIKGAKGTLSQTIHPNISAKVENDSIIVTRMDDTAKNKALHGLTRALLNNMVIGTTAGFEKKLQIEGVGYKAVAKDKHIVFSLGYSHTIEFKVVEGVKCEIGQKGEISVKGISKELVGQVAANIRSLRKPDPYKAKGIRYSDEVIIKKVGKSGAK